MRSRRRPKWGSPTEIHIAVIADVDNPIVPNLFKAPATRSKASRSTSTARRRRGCLAGRKVVVDFYDSKLNPNATTNAEIQACRTTSPWSGTSAVFADLGRQHAQLQGLDRRGDGPARHPVRRRRARRSSAPTSRSRCAAAGRSAATPRTSTRRRSTPTSVAATTTREVRRSPRRLRLRQRLQVGT